MEFDFVVELEQVFVVANNQAYIFLELLEECLDFSKPTVHLDNFYYT